MCTGIVGAVVLIALDVDLAPYYGALGQLRETILALGGPAAIVALYRVLRDKPVNANAEVASVATLDTAEETRRQVVRLAEGLASAGIVLPEPMVLPTAPPAMTTGPAPVVAEPTEQVVQEQVPMPWEDGSKARGRRRG